MQTDKKILKLPQELEKLRGMQDSHHKAIKQNLKLQWREYLIGEINRTISNQFKPGFFEQNLAVYEATALKNIIVRFECILNTFLREFTHTSIDDWVSFIKSYTIPKYDKEELWAAQVDPMVKIHLAIRQPIKDKKKRLKRVENVDAPAADEDDSDYNKLINYSPSLEACESYMLQCVDMITKSNNEFTTLEAELMRFLSNQLD